MDKKEIDSLVESIDRQKRDLKRYDEMQFEIDKLNDSLSKCIEIVNGSIDNEEVNGKLSEYKIENEVLYKKSSDVINKNMRDIENNIQAMYRKMNNKKDEKEQDND